MPHSDMNDADLVTVADGGGALDFPVEIFVPDGSGATRSLLLNGCASVPRVLERCADHVIARGICVDCTRAASRLVWAT